MKILKNVTKCFNCGSYLQYNESDIEKCESGYGVATYGNETYIAKYVKCPKCNNRIEVYE